MILPAYGIGFPRERRERGDLRRMIEAEGVQMIARREGLDAREQRALGAPGKHEMADRPVPAQGELREGHPHLKRDPGLFGQNDERSALLQQDHERIVDGANVGGSALEMSIEIVPAAGVSLVAVREAAGAGGTEPELRKEACHAG